MSLFESHGGSEWNHDTQSLPAAVQQALADLHDRFVAAWDSGQPISIEEAVASVDESLWLYARSDMICVEIDLRRDAGQTPKAEDYLSRFPDDSQLIHAAVVEGKPASSTDPLARVKWVGRYLIRRKLGKGAQGVVWLGYDPLLSRNVVLKFYPQQIGAAKREARVLAEIDSVYVLKPYDVLQWRGGDVLILPYVDNGICLAEYSFKQLGSVRDKALIIAQVAAGIAAAHAKDWIHRDIKPGNILIGPDKVARVIDFGQASTISTGGDGGSSGTPQYMAPEQAEGLRLTAETDVFSLGAVLYSMLTGKSPYPHEKAAAFAAAKTCSFDRTLLDRPEIPVALRDVCLKAMEFDPADRYASAQEFCEAVVAAAGLPGFGPTESSSDQIKAIAPEPEAVTVVASPWTKTLVRSLAGIAATLLLALVGLVATQTGRAASTTPVVDARHIATLAQKIEPIANEIRGHGRMLLIDRLGAPSAKSATTAEIKQLSLEAESMIHFAEKSSDPEILRKTGELAYKNMYLAWYTNRPDRFISLGCRAMDLLKRADPSQSVAELNALRARIAIDTSWSMYQHAGTHPSRVLDGKEILRDVILGQAYALAVQGCEAAEKAFQASRSVENELLWIEARHALGLHTHKGIRPGGHLESAQTIAMSIWNGLVREFTPANQKRFEAAGALDRYLDLHLRVLNTQGLTLNGVGNYDAAERGYRDAIQIAATLVERSAHDERLQAFYKLRKGWAYANLAMTYGNKKEAKREIEACSQAVEELRVVATGEHVHYDVLDGYINFQGRLVGALLRDDQREAGRKVFAALYDLCKQPDEVEPAQPARIVEMAAGHAALAETEQDANALIHLDQMHAMIAKARRLFPGDVDTHIQKLPILRDKYMLASK